MKSTMKTMVLSLTIMTAAAAAILALVKMYTTPHIAEALDRQKQEALESVLPPFSEVTGSEGDNGFTLYRATGEGGENVGVAVEAFSDAGFSNRIVILFGFDASGGLSGYKVLSHSETPGLGANMDTWFRAEGTNHNLIGSTSPLEVSKDGGSVDAITGATITSRAFLDALNKARTAAFDQQ